MKIIRSEKDLDNIVLDKNDVHIWHADLDKLQNNKDFYSDLLSQDERNRADSFHFEKDSVRFIIGRGLLRSLLAFYSGIRENLIEINYSEYGKPFISRMQSPKSLQFNVSHSENYITFSFANIADVGIDIEFLKPIQNILELAERYFSVNEFRQLLALHEQKRLEGFYNCWTRKEATIKAIGEGLSFPLKDFDVSLIPGEVTEITKVSGRAANLSTKINLYSFGSEKNLIGALAVIGNVTKIYHFKLDDGTIFHPAKNI